MLSEIWTIKGKNPCAIYVYKGSVKCIIEENKINKHPTEYPTQAVPFVKALFNEKECEILSLENDDIIKELPHPYWGICYDKFHIAELIRKSGLHYQLYIHDPYNEKYTTPKQFFNDVANLIKSGKKVGWFQDRWSIDNLEWGSLNIDLNRCILEKNLIKELRYDKDFEKLIKDNNLLNSVINQIGYFPDILNLKAYNPQEAIDKLKNKEIDVLVIANLVVARKKEDLEV